MNPVELFYKNSTVLVTGGNGFLGTALVEKLLRCFDVKRVFLLLRAKNNENFEQRSRHFFEKDVKNTECDTFDYSSITLLDFQADKRAARR